jgi:hypothetical protein
VDPIVCPVPSCCVLLSYDGGLLRSRVAPKLEDHPLSALRDCLFSNLAITFQGSRDSYGLEDRGSIPGRG